jgi:transcriptional regulator GlxA family with amidase domain
MSLRTSVPSVYCPSAGISAGIDLALGWVEEDCGSTIAHEAARELVLFLRRPAGQPQLSISLAAQASEMRTLQELQLWIAENLQRRLSVEDLTGHVAMSVRNFEGVFTREVGIAPAQYVMHLRVEASRRQLEHTDRGFKQVAEPAPSIMLAKLPFRYRSMVGCQPNLAGVVPFLPPLLSSAQHMRAPVVAETLRNSQAATGSSY